MYHRGNGGFRTPRSIPPRNKRNDRKLITIIFIIIYIILGMISHLSPDIPDPNIFIEMFLLILLIVTFISLEVNPGQEKSKYQMFKSPHQSQLDKQYQQINTGEIIDLDFKYCRFCRSKNPLDKIKCLVCGEKLE